MSVTTTRSKTMPDSLNVLLVGNGGREHALAWKLKQSPRLGTLFATQPTNAGLAPITKPFPIKINLEKSNHFDLIHACQQEKIGLVIIGPEAPLAAGLTDSFEEAGIPVFGPTKAGAQIEADKAYAKQLMKQAAVPNAESQTFQHVDAAINYVTTREEPCVIKATGLAAGKGVFVCETVEEATDAINTLMVENAFGNAGNTIIIEEKLSGQEVSVLALVDGRTIWMLDPAQDHKQLHEGDTGPNTGGMGAYSPTPVLDDEMLNIIDREVFVPIVDALRREGIIYRGILYAGLMLTPAGPKVLEFNCRFGDPECQPLMTRLKGDLLELCWATAHGKLADVDLTFDERTACCVVMCAEGYPASPRKGDVIHGLDQIQSLAGPDESLTVFHAGTTVDPETGDILTNGGRVLGINALAANLRRAQELANQACETIQFNGAFYRKDIGSRVLQPAAS